MKQLEINAIGVSLTGDKRNLDDIIYISSPEELNNIRWNEGYSFHCKKCGKLTIVKRLKRDRIDHASKLICVSCFRKLDASEPGLSKTNPIDVTNNDVNVVDKLGHLRYYTITCKKCGNITLKRHYNHNECDEHRFLCRTCMAKDSLEKKIKGDPNAIKISSVAEYQKLPYHVWFTFTCINCGKTETTLKLRKNYNKNRWTRLLCADCSGKQTRKDLYGDENYNNLNKRKETNLERFGTDNVMKSSYGKDALKKSFNAKYNVDSVGELLRQDEYLEKSKKTNLKNNGSEKYMQFGTDEFNQLMLDRYGKINPIDIEEFVKASQNTCLAKYGNKYYVASEAHKKRCAEILTENFGVNNYFKSEEYKLMYSMVNLRYFIYYYGITFDSSWELAVWIYCIDHNIPITRTPCKLEYLDSLNIKHFYFPDFIINGKLVEIKGSQYFKPDGTMYYPYTKRHHYSETLSSEEKAYYDDLYERKHQCGLSHGVEFWTDKDCRVYLEYCDNRYPGWKKLYRKDNIFNPSYWCNSFINLGFYQPQDITPVVLKATPFDKPDKDGYVFTNNKPITPFDKGVS